MEKKIPTKTCYSLYAKKLEKINLNFHKSILLKNLLQLKVSKHTTADKI